MTIDIESGLHKHHITITLQLLFFLDVSSFKYTIIFISSLVKNFLT